MVCYFNIISNKKVLKSIKIYRGIFLNINGNYLWHWLHIRFNEKHDIVPQMFLIAISNISFKKAFWRIIFNKILRRENVWTKLTINRI